MELPISVMLLYQTNSVYLSYFNMCRNYRVRSKLTTLLAGRQYFDPNRDKLKHICAYDKQIGFVVKEIRTILDEKVKFWKELCKDDPELKILEKEGRKLVDRI